MHKPPTLLACLIMVMAAAPAEADATAGDECQQALDELESTVKSVAELDLVLTAIEEARDACESIAVGELCSGSLTASCETVERFQETVATVLEKCSNTSGDACGIDTCTKFDVCDLPSDPPVNHGNCKPTQIVGEVCASAWAGHYKVQCGPEYSYPGYEHSCEDATCNPEPCTGDEGCADDGNHTAYACYLTSGGGGGSATHYAGYATSVRLSEFPGTCDFAAGADCSWTDEHYGWHRKGEFIVHTSEVEAYALDSDETPVGSAYVSATDQFVA